MATIQTLRDQLAFLGEFGNRASGTHIGTRLDMMPYEEMIDVPMDDILAGKGYRPYRLNAEGEKLAAASPLRACFTWLRENGFHYVAPRRGAHTQKGNFIKYDSDETDENGRPVATAFISRWARVYVNRRTPGDPGAKLTFDGAEALRVEREFANVRPAGVR